MDFRLYDWVTDWTNHWTMDRSITYGWAANVLLDDHSLWMTHIMHDYIIPRLSVLQLIETRYQFKLKLLTQSMIQDSINLKYLQMISRTPTLLPHAEKKYGPKQVTNLVLKKEKNL